MRPGAEVPWTSQERRTYRRNASFGVANGALLMLGNTLLHPIIVLALFVSQISDSYVLVGLVPAISTGVWFLPQIFVATIARRYTLKLPLVTWSIVARAVSIGILGTLGFTVADQSPSLLLVLFFVLYVSYNLAAGVANVPMVDIAARAIPPTRRRLYFGQRSVWGGVLGFLAGFIVQRILSQPDALLANYALLFFAAFLAFALAAYASALIQEPSPSSEAPQPSLTTRLRDIPVLWANIPFRHFLSYRSLLAFSALADPFYVVYAHQQLDAPASVIGVYISAMMAARFGATLVWSPLAERYGSRLVLQISAVLRMSIPILALALPPLLRWPPVVERLPGGDATLVYSFGLVFVAYGVALSGLSLANMTYLLDIAPDHERPAYVGAVNTSLGVIAFVPVIGGFLANQFGFHFLFLVTFLIGFAGVFASGFLHEPRVGGVPTLSHRSQFFIRSRRLRS